jgi:hypothetical protein
MFRNTKVILFNFIKLKLRKSIIFRIERAKIVIKYNRKESSLLIKELFEWILWENEVVKFEKNLEEYK